MYAEERRRPLVAWMLIALVYAAVSAIAMSSWWSRSPETLALGLLFDLTVTCSVIAWLVAGLDRQTGLRTAATLTAVGLTFAGLMFPPNRITHSGAFSLLAAASKIVIISMVAFGVARACRRYSEMIEQGTTTQDALREALRLVIGPAAPYAAAELSVIGLATTGWFKPAPDGDRTFTAYRECGWPALMAGFAMMVVVEATMFHILVATVSHTWAWVLTATSVYTLFWLAADVHALRLYPMSVTDERLLIRLGVRWQTAVDLRDVRSVQPADDRRRRDHRNIGAPMFETVIIAFNAPITLKGPLGIHRRVRSIGLPIDEPEKFIATVREAKTADARAIQR